MAMIFGDILESNAYIISSSGDLLGYTEKLDVNNARIKNMFKEKNFLKDTPRPWICSK